MQHKYVRFFFPRYACHKPALMTDELFKSFLQEWDNELLFQNRKILLLVDTCQAHLTGAYLTNIELAFMPPNTTVLQPCEQGIAQMVKATFRYVNRSDLYSE